MVLVKMAMTKMNEKAIRGIVESSLDLRHETSYFLLMMTIFNLFLAIYFKRK